MKKLTFIFLSACLGLPAWAERDMPDYGIQGNDTVCQIFLYSPGPQSGLHVAYLADSGQWKDVGQLLSCDYGPWGAEKKMYDPFVLHANDGTWRAVWSVNDYAPCFAAAYSEDLLVWRPQDYPKLSVQGVRKPVIFQMDANSFDIYVKTKSGNRYVKASKDFRAFEEDPESSTIEDIAWLRDTATVDGKRHEGNLYEVPKLQLDYLFSHFSALAGDAERSRETMRDDVRRFASLPKTIEATLNVNLGARKQISDKLIGVFFEDISYAADGGLYAEMLQNRDFEYSAADHHGWAATTGWSSERPLTVSTEQPLSKNNPHHVVMTSGSLRNAGWGGMDIRSEARYDFSLFARNIKGDKKNLEVRLVTAAGQELAAVKVKVTGTAWARYQGVLDVKAKTWDKIDRTIKGNGEYLLEVCSKDEQPVAIDMVSLFPQDTYKGHGLRRDLAEAIAGLHPKFVRFPGGCLTHGQGLDNIYHWTESVGPWQDRKPAMNIWNYHQTRGLGFYEYFLFCEDIGAEPLPVLAAGVPCQNSAAGKDGYAGQQGGIPMADMPAYCEEILHLIEWANGDPATSKWAKMRAEAGHPAPFNLKYIGIGNEDLISTAFRDRYLMICKAIKDKYPHIIICGTVGPFHAPSSDYIEGWKIANDHRDIIDMVDEHYYESAGWFMHHQDYYDNYDRKGPKVYLGEYASRTRTHESALAEALYLCNIERNGDVVAMTSYAPLLCHEQHQNWNPDLIYFNQQGLTTTPSYETQRLFSLYAGNEYIASSLELPDSLRYRVGASLVEDTKTGHRYLKLVNALPSTLQVAIRGMPLPANCAFEGFKAEVTEQQVKKEKGIIHDKIILPPYAVRSIIIK